MDRHQILLRDIDATQLGIEIAPWMNPLVPKKAGYRSLSLDVFPTDVLRQTAADDPNVPEEAIANIEDVDIIGTADELAEHVERRDLLGKVDYILSSHNFEHLPNPIRFLQGCEKALREGGVLTMALPDYRTCFDYFRPFTTTAEFIAAFFAEVRAPTPEQSFMQNSRHCRLMHSDGQMDGSFTLDMDARDITPLPGIRDAFDVWRSRKDGGELDYRDTHCWAFSPSSFALIIEDLAHLGLTNLRLEEISATNGNEFYARLRSGGAALVDDNTFYTRRTELMHASKDEAAENTRLVQSLRRRLAAMDPQAAT